MLRSSQHVRFLVLLLALIGGTPVAAVTSRVHRHAGARDFSKGVYENLLVGSRGNLRLGRQAQVLADSFEGAWSINSVVVIGGALYLGTSPNGGIYRYAFGELRQVYPDETGNDIVVTDSNDISGIRHEHVFAMCADVAGRLVVAISGVDCRVDRLGVDGVETIFRPEGVHYIFALAADESGRIFVGTGPTGQVYQLDALGRSARLVYTCKDKNILSLAVGKDGWLYAGTDGRGLVYRIDPSTQTATVLYDSPQPEITGLICSDTPGASDLFALATSAKVLETERYFADTQPRSGRSDGTGSDGDEEAENLTGGSGAVHLEIANMQPPKTAGAGSAKRKLSRSEAASSLYRINQDGYIVDTTQRQAVFLCLVKMDQQILVGSGNDGQLLQIDLVGDEMSVLYEDPQATQVTTVSLDGEDVYVGTANPARLIRLSKKYAAQGSFTSDLIDAGQPARWGKLQLDAEIPDGCAILMSCRSGNVEEVNDPTFSDWTEPEEMTGPISLGCPIGRFCQYRLLLKTDEGLNTPLIRAVAVASSVPNLPPVVESIEVLRMNTPLKRGYYKISYEARDSNGDDLQYSISLRKRGRNIWIQVEEDFDEADYEWNSRTVEDGQYEIRIVASDAPTNNPDTALTASRISDPVVVDNTGPVVRGHYVEKNDSGLTLGLVIRDEFSRIDRLEYTLDSQRKWHGAVPEDGVYDSKEETFQLVLKEIDNSEHVISIRVRDDLGNITYRSFDVIL